MLGNDIVVGKGKKKKKGIGSIAAYIITMSMSAAVTCSGVRVAAKTV